MEQNIRIYTSFFHSPVHSFISEIYLYIFLFVKKRNVLCNERKVNCVCVCVYIYIYTYDIFVDCNWIVTRWQQYSRVQYSTAQYITVQYSTVQ
jgi:hypothetical protein